MAQFRIFRTREIWSSDSGELNGIPLGEGVQILSSDGSILIISDEANRTIDLRGTAPENFLELIAASPIDAFKLVAAKPGEMMDLADKDQAMPAIGMVRYVVSLNVRGRVFTNGVFENDAWNFTPMAILFAGTLGEISEIPPMSGYVQKIGIALSPSKIVLCLDHHWIRRS